ncbi:MAG: hypothetical protein GQ477_03380 [Nanohaloarchaea archaeon]|nr:hypothetical protein [Candidatus Nanohaloarchaea archaeon]
MSDNKTLYVIDGGIHTPDDTKAYLEFGIDLNRSDLSTYWAEQIGNRFESLVKKNYQYYTGGSIEGVICLIKTDAFPEKIYVDALSEQGFTVYPSAEIQTTFGHFNVIKGKSMEFKSGLDVGGMESVSDILNYVKENEFILTLAHPSTVDYGMRLSDVKLFESLQKDYKNIFYDRNAWVKTLTENSNFGMAINKIFPKATEDYNTKLKIIASTDDTTPNIAFSGKQITIEPIDGTLDMLKIAFLNTGSKTDPISASYILKKILTKFGLFKTF